MNENFQKLSKKAQEKLKKEKQPDWTKPMLATLTKNYFSDKDWIFERKLDGERCLIFKKSRQIKLLSRNKKQLNNQYPEIVTAIKKQNFDFIVDGEIVAFDGKVTSFSKLQKRMHRKNADTSVKVFFYVFDIIYFEGFNLSKLPLKERKHLLKRALQFDSDTIRYTPHRNEEGEKYLKEACGKHWEGLIAKNRNSIYSHKRSTDWLKFKCDYRQEFIICGYTDPQGDRVHFGALLIGFYDEDKLKYAGKVGTGFDNETLKRLFKIMKPLEQKTNPLDEDIKGTHIHWLSPELVGQFRFSEWTKNNKLRHPSFQGLRDDKSPISVKKEVPNG